MALEFLHSGFQNIWRTNYAITLTASDSSRYNSNKYCSWFGVPAAVLSLLGYYTISSDQVTIRHGIIPQKTCFFNKLPFICFVVNVISPINVVVCEQISQYCVMILIIVQRDAPQSILFIILQVHSACFRCQPHPSSGVHKTVTTASGTVQLPPSNVARLAWPRWREVAAKKKNMTSTGGCSYRWVWLTPETRRVNLQNNKQTALCCISLDSY